MTQQHATEKAAARGNPQTRALIMDAAERVLKRKNFFDANVDDFVQEAGVARGTFYIYFKDKYDILAALSRRLNDQLFEQSHLALDRSLSPYGKLRESLRRVIAAWEEHSTLFRATTQVALMRPDFLELNQELRLPFIRQIHRDIERNIDRGRTPPIDAAVAAKALAAMMDWFCLTWFGLDEPPYAGAERDVEHVADHLALLWYRAIFAADPGLEGEVSSAPPSGSGGPNI